MSISSLLGLFLVALSLSCGSTTDDPHENNTLSHETDAGPIHDLNFESIVGLQATSETFVITLTAADPDPAIKGMNNWEVLLEDTAGDRISGATIVIEPRMPQHNHGTIPATFTATEFSEAGTYKFADVYLLMIGDWEVTITVAANNLSETLVFHVYATN